MAIPWHCASPTYRGTTDAVLPDMQRSLLELVIQKHRIESIEREQAWSDELTRRRREVAACCRVDVDALRAKLAI